MKEGYKKTELGFIPDTWNIKKLNDISIITMGQSPDSETYNEDGIGIPFFQGKTEFGKISPIVKKWCTKPTKIAEPLDILMSVRAPVGDVNINIEQSCIGRGLASIRATESYYKFLYYYLQIAKDRLKSSSQGSTFTAINSSDLIKLKVAVPTLKEQEKIAEILSTVDSQINDTDKLIGKTKELKKGLMKRLLTKGIGHTEFKKTEFGDIPVEWEVKQIKNIGDTTSGGTPNRSKKYYYEDGDICWVKTGELTNKYIYDSEEKINEIAVKESSAKLIPINSVIVAMYGATIGKISINKIEITTNQACCSIMCKKDIISYEFLFYNLSFNKEKLIELGAGGAQPNISQQIIKEFKIVLPSLNEQEKIVEILVSVDRKIEEYENKKIKLEEVKKGLMQQLLAGKIRVKI